MRAQTPTIRLWLTEPGRKTALAQVTAVRGDAFRLDRSLYCPRSRTYRHPQDPDHGVIWTPDGEKRRLVSVYEDAGLWHRLRGATPAVGDTLRCHLEVSRREETARGHLALHLLLHALPRDAGGLDEDPEVRGGGHVRFTFDVSWIDPKILKAWRDAALALASRDLPLSRIHVTDTEVPHRLTPQPFSDGILWPGPVTTKEAFLIDGVGAYPCDGTLPERTGAVKDLVVRAAHPDRRGRLVVVFQSGP